MSSSSPSSSSSPAVAAVSVDVQAPPAAATTPANTATTAAAAAAGVGGAEQVSEEDFFNQTFATDGGDADPTAINADVNNDVNNVNDEALKPVIPAALNSNAVAAAAAAAAAASPAAVDKPETASDAAVRAALIAGDFAAAGECLLCLSFVVSLFCLVTFFSHRLLYTHPPTRCSCTRAVSRLLRRRAGLQQLRRPCALEGNTGGR
jgi:hypothetical protein